jgi:hypothetical protein
MLGLALAVLATLSVGAAIYRYEIDRGPHHTLTRLIALDAEGGLAAWYQSVTLLSCGVLCGLVAAARHRARVDYVRHWAWLAAIFAYLAMDEASALHEQTIEPLRDALHTSDFLYYAWIVPALAGLVALALIYLRWFLQLPLWVRRRVLLGAVLYVAGGIGFESIGGDYMVTHGDRDLTYDLLTNFEEILESLGVIAFVYAFAGYLVTETTGAIEVRGAESTSPAAIGRADDPSPATITAVRGCVAPPFGVERHAGP